MTTVRQRRDDKLIKNLQRQYDSSTGKRWRENAYEKRMRLLGAKETLKRHSELQEKASRQSRFLIILALVLFFFVPAAVAGAFVVLDLASREQWIGIYIAMTLVYGIVMFASFNRLSDRVAIRVAREKSDEILKGLDGQDVVFRYDDGELPAAGEDEMAARSRFAKLDSEFLLFAHAMQLRKRRVAYSATTCLALVMIVAGFVLLAAGVDDPSVSTPACMVLIFGGCVLLALLFSEWSIFKNDFYRFGKYDKSVQLAPDFRVNVIEMELVRRNIDWLRMS